MNSSAPTQPQFVNESVWWSVRFTLPAGYAGPMTGSHEPWLSDREIRSASFDNFGADGVDTGSGLMLELRAPDAATALASAYSAAERSISIAGLRPAVLERVWVAPLDDSDASSQRFLSEADHLVADERYEMAVLAAQVHFELQVRTLLRRAVEAEDRQHLKPLSQMPAIGTLNSKHKRAIVTAVLEIDDPAQHPVWPKFKAHIDRRNGIAHEGQVVAAEDAIASIHAVGEMWKHLLSGRGT